MMDSDDLSSFGTLLKAFRTRRGLTQHQLAEQLGVRRNTIGTWERGDFLPGSKGIVLELARHLHLDEQEIRQLLEASLTALAPHWSIPFRRNPFFTGREEVLEALHVQLGVNNTVALAPSSALSGLGGIGKTQIALEYVYRYGLEYSAVFWIGAETEEQIVSSFVQIAEVLQLLGREDNNHQRVVSAVKGWLSTHEKWLLVWDNVEELSLLDRFQPSHQRGALLLTTRRQVLATHAQSFPLHSMELDEGLLLLLRRAKLLPLEAGSQQMRQFAALYPASCQAASDLVETLGGLPLALDQAGAYLEATQCGVPAYLQLFHHEYASLLAYRGEGIRDHPESVDTTFQLAIRKAACFHPVLFDLLRACAFLHADAIPEELFRQGGEHLGAELAAVTSSDLAWNQLMASACGYSLLWRHPETNTLSLHRLVQQVVRQSLGEQEHVRWLRRIVEALNKIFPEAPFASEVVKQRRRCFPHVLTVTQAIPDQASNQALLEVLRKAADYLRDVSPKDKQAEAFYQRALRIGEQILGPCHAEVAATLQGLAGLYRSQGKYVQAEEAYQRALRIREQTVGPTHPLTADLLHSLATLYWRQERYEQVEPLYRRALHIREQTLGPDHPDCALSFTGLGSLYGMQGEYGQAEVFFHRALALLQRILGLQHPRVAVALHNLGEINLLQGKYEQAEPFFQQALFIWEQELGPEHPDVAYSLTCLASLYMKEGKGKQAEPLYWRALSITEHVWGPQSPVVAQRLNSLANLYAQRGEPKQAEPLYERALRIQEQFLDQPHPETAQTLHDLALLRQQKGQLDEACSLAERALLIRSTSLGETHPCTVASRMLHTQLVQEQRHGAGEKPASGHPSDPQDMAGGQEYLSTPVMRVAVRGATGQVAYTRRVRMREVTFICAMCRQTVTQLHYPSGRVQYCSEACRAIRGAQLNEKRAAKQREKRRNESRVQRQARQGKDM